MKGAFFYGVYGFRKFKSKLWVPMNVHREQNMKKEDQKDAAIRCLLLTSVSTCFGHHYSHLQENKSPVTAFGVLGSYDRAS